MDQVNKLKNRKVLAAVAIFLVLAVGGGLFFWTRHSSTPEEDTSIIQTANLPELSPDAIGMTVTVRKDKKALMFELKKAEDITHVNYEIRWFKELEGNRIEEGILGEMNIAEDGITKTDFREFGTCSAGKCKYDKVVSDVTIKMAVTKKDGKTYQVTKIVKL